MTLPKLSTPTYELVVPSTGKNIKYRPFLVKEEKSLLLAMETEDENQMANAVKTILSIAFRHLDLKFTILPCSTWNISF